MTNTTSVPKSMTRIKEEIQGMPFWYVIISVGCLVLAIILLGVIFYSGFYIQILGMVLLFILLAVYFVYLRTPKRMERSELMMKYFMRSLKGETLIAKFALPAGFLEQFVPVIAFHKDGIIEFMQNKFGLLLLIEPSRVADDDIDTHIAKTRSLLDSLYGKLLVKMFVCSVPDKTKPLTKNVVNIINTQERTKEQRAHLDSIVTHSQNNQNTVVQWKFYIFLSLGDHPSLKKAEIAKKQYYAGFEAKLQKLGVLVMPLKDPYALADAYRQCFMQGS